MCQHQSSTLLLSRFLCRGLRTEPLLRPSTPLPGLPSSISSTTMTGLTEYTTVVTLITEWEWWMKINPELKTVKIKEMVLDFRRQRGQAVETVTS